MTDEWALSSNMRNTCCPFSQFWLKVIRKTWPRSLNGEKPHSFVQEMLLWDVQIHNCIGNTAEITQVTWAVRGETHSREGLSATARRELVATEACSPDLNLRDASFDTEGPGASCTDGSATRTWTKLGSMVQKKWIFSRRSAATALQ